MRSGSVPFFLAARAAACALGAVLIALPAQAQLAPTTQPRPGDLPTQTAQPVKVERAWIRARLPGQDASAGYMTLTNAGSAARKLVAASTSAAGSTELHQMSMDGDVMRMRAVDAIDLPAGQTVELKPGGFHLMLMKLKTPLAKNTSVPLTLTFEDADGKRTHEEMKVPVLDQPPPLELLGPARRASQ